MRTIRMAVIALSAAVAACNLYWHDTPEHGPDGGVIRPDGDRIPPDAWVIDDAPNDSSSGDGCHGGDGGPLPDAAVGDGGCDNGTGSGCGLPDAAVGDGGCNGVDCYPDAGCNGVGCH